MPLRNKIAFLVLLVALLASPMFIKGPDGNPIMRPGDWQSFDHLPSISEQFSKLKQQARELTDEVADSLPSEPQTFYKWRDEDGVWQYSDKPPEQPTTPVKTLNIDPNANVLSRQKPSDLQPPQNSAAKPESENPAAISLEKLPHLLNDVRPPKQQLENREQEFERLLPTPRS